MTQNNEREAFESLFPKPKVFSTFNEQQKLMGQWLDCKRGWETAIAYVKKQNEQQEAVSTLEDWLTINMPSGTVIGNPLWWATKIRNVLAFTEAPKQIPAVTSYDLASEEDETVYWLQSDIQKKGWGPFKTEIDAWKYLFGREPSEEEIAEYKNADWYVGFINSAPTNTEVGND